MNRSEDEDLNFEEFQTPGKSHKKTISIRKSGQIGINVGTTRAYNLLEYDGFVLHYDRKNKIMGIEPTNKRSRPGFITARQHNDEIQLAAKSFYDHYNIPYDETRRVDVLRYDTDLDMILVDISEVVER